MALKAVCIGFPKSGTTTLWKAFKLAGFNSVHRHQKGRVPAGYLMMRSYHSHEPITTRLPNVEVVTQLDSCLGDTHVWPQMDYRFLHALIEQEPEVKLILPTRPPKKIVKSIKNHGDLRDRINTSPGLYGRRTRNGDIVRWIKWHYLRIQQEFGDYENYMHIDIESPDVRQRLEREFEVEFPWWGVANRTKKRG